MGAPPHTPHGSMFWREAAGHVCRASHCLLLYVPGQLAPSRVVADAGEYGGTAWNSQQPLHHSRCVLSRPARRWRRHVGSFHRCAQLCSTQTDRYVMIVMWKLRREAKRYSSMHHRSKPSPFTMNRSFAVCSILMVRKYKKSQNITYKVVNIGINETEVKTL